jgi:UDP-N-acetylglucosamine 2-epimerase (non-hydrolysing)
MNSGKKILVVLGTRPEAIKLAPVIDELKKDSSLDTMVCVTAQHREMLDQVLDVFDIAPDYDLDIMTDDQTPLDVTGSICEKLPQVLDDAKPSMVLIQGDTTTAFVSAWVAFHRKLPVAHVEAGLRTGNPYEPFPEEMNRKLIAGIADLHFAPTQESAQNLLTEGVPEKDVYTVGNTIVDALKGILKLEPIPVDKRLADLEGQVVLVTMHRRENLGEPLERICNLIGELADSHDDTTIVFQVHRNPRVMSCVDKIIPEDPRIILTEPLDYLSFVHLMSRASLIMTDSGGIQEEATVIGTPTLVMRRITERPEALECDWIKLVGTSRERILNESNLILSRGMKPPVDMTRSPFGDGHTSERIVRILKERLHP